MHNESDESSSSEESENEVLETKKFKKIKKDKFLLGIKICFKNKIILIVFFRIN